MPIHDLSFERVYDLGEFAAAATPQRFDLFGPALSMPPAPVTIMAGDGHERDGELQYRASLPAIGIYALPGHLIGGGGVARAEPDATGVPGFSLFWRDDCLPNDLRDAFGGSVTPPAGWAGSLADASAERIAISGPLAVFSHPNTVYGHMLLETVPRLWLLRVLADLGRPLPVALDTRSPGWLADLAARLLPDELIVRFDGASQVLVPDVTVVPSMMQSDYYLHPAFNLMVADLLSRLAPSPSVTSRRLFLSRAGLGDHTAIANADEIERRLAAAGFEVLRPETMGFAEQLAVYAGAATMVSEYGSASHNALFAPRGSVHVVMNRINALQERIAALRAQPLGIVEPTGGYVVRGNGAPGVQARAPVDVDAMLRLIDRMEAAARPRPTRARVPATREVIPVEGYVINLTDVGEKPVLAAAARIALPAFLHSEPVDPTIAPYSQLFHAAGPHGYDAHPVMCARLPGAQVLGDSGVVVFGGRVLADSADSANWSRAAAFEITVEGGRVADAPPMPRSHPGQSLFVGFTGRWDDDDSFLIECLPRLVGYALTTGSLGADAVMVPESRPNSIQARALELLALPGVMVVAAATPTVGREIWLQSGIDRWRPSPFVVAAARVLAERVLATAGTHRRVYLRAAAAAVPALDDFDPIAPVLAAHGFAVVTPGTLGLDERIALLRGADVVVAEAAAGLGHVVFCRPGTRVLELFNPVFVQPSTYALAAVASLGYGFLVGTHVPSPGQEQPGMGSRYAISASQLERAFAALLDAPPEPETARAADGGVAEAMMVDTARRLSLPAPFFAAPALPPAEAGSGPVQVVARHDAQVDGAGRVGPRHPDAVAVGGAIAVGVAADDGGGAAQPLSTQLPRLFALRQVVPGMRAVLPRDGHARRIAELLGLTDDAVAIAPGASATADAIWVVEGIGAGGLPPDVVRRAGQALRDAVPVNDAERMALLPTRLHLCAAQPDPTLAAALSPHGFVAVPWPTLSVDEQARLMRGATLLLIEPGLADALALARPGTRVLQAGPPTGRLLAAACALPYGCVSDPAQLTDAVEALAT